MKTIFLYIVVIVLTKAFWNPFFPQQPVQQKNLTSTGKVNVQLLIFDEIETGILTNDVTSFSHYFTSQPYISLINGVNGYYSSNQAFYIMEDFFNSFKVVSFDFEEIKTEGPVSYGKGTYYFEKKGKREAAHLYLTLSKAGSRWYITQISIN